MLTAEQQYVKPPEMRVLGNAKPSMFNNNNM